MLHGICSIGTCCQHLLLLVMQRPCSTDPVDSPAQTRPAVQLGSIPSTLQASTLQTRLHYKRSRIVRCACTVHASALVTLKFSQGCPLALSIASLG